ncbi:unnamed protein product [Dovyalis caffra]|uniref:Uncharacterized protein n=1 Tax=Dovyalis caffra TaxID=77055 RepID=A0AAV1S5L5_9ROSI|nr:unnamed protein product [Dovyalis caffra]
MAVSIKPLLILSIIAFSFTYITSEPLPELEPEPEPQHFSLENVLDQLKSHISLLDTLCSVELDYSVTMIFLILHIVKESRIDERARELRRKEEKIRQMEMIIHEKSERIELLQSETESLQVDKLRKQAESQSQKNDAVEIRANVAEKKIKEISSKLETLQKVNDEQKNRIHETEYARQLVEKETMKLKFDQILREWLPHWLAVHFSNFQVNNVVSSISGVDVFLQENFMFLIHSFFHKQYYVVTHWNEHGRQAWDMRVQKVLEKKSQIDKWAEPHFEAIYIKLMPMFKDWWFNCISYLRTCIPPLFTKSHELFHTLKNSALHHAINIQEMVDPYLKEARKFTEPYINQLATMTRPHLDKVHVVLKPYTRRMLRAYKIFARSATVEKMLKKNELTRSLATIELAWFAASAILTIPAIFMFKLYSAIFRFVIIFRKKAKKHHHSSHTHHLRRGAKRSHAASLQDLHIIHVFLEQTIVNISI